MIKCEACGKECDTIEIDEGGMEEIWGARMWHAQWVTVSDCCQENYEETKEE